MLYDTFALSYDRFLAPFERRFLGRWRRETLSLLPPDAKILEIGAGTGANFPFYPPAEFAVASEISVKMLDFARTKSLSMQFVQADAVALPFVSNSFDAAFATLVFCSVHKPIDAFRELQRVIRPGGTIVLLEHVRPDGMLGFAFDVFNIFSMALIDDCFNRRTAALARESGLNVVEVRSKALGAVNLIVCRNEAERVSTGSDRGCVKTPV